MTSHNRQLAAILFTDIVGYTAIMQQNESMAVALVMHYTQVLKEKVIEHNGQILNDYGDGSLCTFPSIVDALQCAIEVQKELQSEPIVPLRIGLHAGEVFFEGNKVMGDSVNIASRIQSLGQTNTILFSKEIADKIKNQLEFKYVSLGKFEFKNVDEPMEIFALTNEGLKVPKREEMSGKLKEINKKYTRSKFFVVAAIVVLIVLGYFLYKNFTAVTGFKGEKSVAVLPFENVGLANDEESLSDDITRDIINNLSKISSLQKVIAWFSVKNYKKTNKTFNEISGELGVAAILSGTIQKDKDKIRIIAELIEAKSNKRLWGNDFEFAGKDVLAIQSRVAIDIVTALSDKVSDNDKKILTRNYTDNVEAYKLYLKGRSFWDQRNRVNYDSAEVNFKKAIDLDPDYALAYAGLADCYTFNQKGLMQTQAIPIARDYALKALSIDSTLTEAKTTLAFIQSHYDFDWEGAKINFEKIIKNNPNYPVAHLYYGNVLLFTGNIDAGLEETKKALSLDPLSSAFNHVLGRNLYLGRKYDSALVQLQKSLILNPNFLSSYLYIGLIFLEKKMFPETMSAFSNLPKGLFDHASMGSVVSCIGYAAIGDKSKASAVLNKMSDDSLNLASAQVAYVYSAMGDADNALKYLELAFENRQLSLIFTNNIPILDPIRKNERFKALLSKIGFKA